MHAVASSSLIARLTRRRPRVHRAPEAADLGTELGMEHWLDEREATTVRAGQATELPAAPAPLPAAPAARRARTAWLPRWLVGAAAR